jgi:hypothetical protein
MTWAEQQAVDLMATYIANYSEMAVEDVIDRAIRETIEECARVCDRMNDLFAGTEHGRGINAGAAACGKRIRALGEAKEGT